MALQDIVSLARKHIGEEYVFGAMVNYTISNHRGPWDCAEFATWCTYQATGKLLGVEPNDARNGDAYTGFWADDARSLNMIVSVEEALRNAGYMLLRLPQQRGRIGHIAISTGNGRDVVEAASRKLGVVEQSAIGRVWDFGIKISLDDADNMEDAYSPALHFRASRNPVYDKRIEQIQLALRKKGFDPGPIDGLFGSAVETAVAQFQRAEGLVIDGIVGKETGMALGLPFWGPVQDSENQQDGIKFLDLEQTTSDPTDDKKDYFTVENPNFRSLVEGGIFSSNPHAGGGKRAFRTNNPGAINFDFNGGGAWQTRMPGFVGRTFADKHGNKTAIYETPEQGIAAWYYLLTNRYGFGSDASALIQELARRYAGVNSWRDSAARNYIRGWTVFSDNRLNENSRIHFDYDDELIWFAKGNFGFELGEPTALKEEQMRLGFKLGREL